MSTDTATRLYHCLIRELERRGRDLRDPLRVAELEREIVPYAAVRRDVGVELKADYEHALLRLLGGEHGLLRLEPAEAREELASEARAPYPSVGLFRKFDQCSVWIDALPDDVAPPFHADDAPSAPLAPSEVDRSADSETARPAASDAGAADSSAGTAPEARDDETSQEQRRAIRDASSSTSTPRPVVRPPRTGAPGRAGTRSVRLHRDANAGTGQSPTVTGDGAAAECDACGVELPPGRTARFCPWCGRDRQLRPCSRCDARLEPGWRFCIRCGHSASKGGG